MKTTFLCLVVLIFVFVYSASETIPEQQSNVQVEKTSENEFAQELNDAVLSFTIDMQQHGGEIKQQLDRVAKQMIDLAKQIPSNNDDPELQKTKERLEQFGKAFVVIEKHLGSSMLEAAINRTLGKTSNETNEAESEFLPILKGVVKVGSFVANAIDGVGSYAGKIQNAANFVNNKVAPFLEKRGMGGLANAAKSVGNGLTKTSNFVAPYEKKLEQKLQPIKNNKFFQGAKKVLNTADALMDVGGLAKNLYKGYKAVKNLPQAIKTSKNLVTNGLKTAKEGVKTIRKGVETARKGLGTAGKGAKTIGNAAKNVIKGKQTVTKGLTVAGKGAKTIGKGVSTIVKGGKQVKNGATKVVNGAKQVKNGVQKGVNAVKKVGKAAIDVKNSVKSIKNKLSPNEGKPKNSKPAKVTSKQMAQKPNGNKKVTTKPSSKSTKPGYARPSKQNNTKPNGSRPSYNKSTSRPTKPSNTRPNRGNRPSYNRPTSSSRPSRPSNSKPSSRPSYSRPQTRPSRPSYSRPSTSRPSTRPSYSSRPSRSSSGSRGRRDDFETFADILTILALLE